MKDNKETIRIIIKGDQCEECHTVLVESRELGFYCPNPECLADAKRIWAENRRKALVEIASKELRVKDYFRPLGMEHSSKLDQIISLIDLLTISKETIKLKDKEILKTDYGYYSGSGSKSSSSSGGKSSGSK